MNLKLETDGDLYEIRYWEFLRPHFPNYEIFWSRFIVPLTERTEGQGIGLKKGLDPLIENLAMAHYTVFYHLGVATYLQLRLEHEFSEDVLFHLSAATEMVERLIFLLAKIATCVSGTEFVNALTEKAIIDITREYFVKVYPKEFERFLDRGQAVNIRLHNIDDLCKLFTESRSEEFIKDFKEWQQIANGIRHYRNVLAHNPRLGTLRGPEGKIYVPKEDTLYKYGLWSSVGIRKDNNDFILLDELLSNFQAVLVDKTNCLWEYLITFMDSVSNEDGYTRLTTSNDLTSVFEGSPQTPPPALVPPSGVSPCDLQ